MALTEQEEFELLSLEREKAMGGGQNVQPPQTEQPQQNVLQQLMQAISQTPNNIIRGVAEPFIKSIGAAGLGINDLMQGGQNVPEYNVPFPGGDIPIKRMQTLPQAVGLGLQGGSMAMGGTPVVGGAAYGAGQAMSEQKSGGEIAGQAALGGLIGKGISVASGKPLINPAVKKIFQYDNVLKQAQKAKVSLDAVRKTLGQAKQIALQEVQDVPAKVDWSEVPQKAINKIKDPIYKVGFDDDGAVINTVGNLDKVKTALNDITTAKDFVEATHMEKRQIMQFAGKVRDSMLKATEEIGKPELAKALADYHNFMDNYSIVNSKLTDKFGNALGNKMKAMFKMEAEPLVKEAWKDIAKGSPEIKSIMGSMKRRELLSQLLKYSGYGTIATGAVGGLGYLINKD